MNKSIVILGGGIAGISAGYYLGKNNSTVYEAQNSYGGLCDNIQIDGFTFDKAVHLSFTNINEARNMFDNTAYISHKPESYNYYNGFWLKHPIQNNLYDLSVEEKIECIKSFIDRPNISKDINNYEQWLYEQFGKAISEKFPKVYTKKYWCDEAKNLETKWIKNRLYRPNIDEVLFGAMSNNTKNAYYAEEMRYPFSGSFKSFLKPMVNDSVIKLNKRAIFINTDSKYVEFDDGTKVYYEKLISSIPLPEIVKIIKDVPVCVKEAAENLVATSMRLISVGFNRSDIAKYLWFYIYNQDIYPSRAYSPNLKSPNNVPTGCSSLQFEVYESKYKKIDVNDDILCEHIYKSILNMGIAEKQDIMFMKVNHEKYANVVFYSSIYKNRKIVRDYLSGKEIKCIGRFGEWDYLWSDQSLLSGKSAADFINSLI